MSYLQTMTMMLASTKNPNHEEHLYELFELIRQMIEELVPQIVEKTLKENYLNVIGEVQTYINGSRVEFEDVKEYLRHMIEEALKDLKIDSF